MNEIIAVDPEAISDPLAARLVFSKVGTHAGRYLLRCPDNWIDSLVKLAHTKGDIERARMEELLINAKKKGSLVALNVSDWDFGVRWLDNFPSLSKIEDLELVVIPDGILSDPSFHAVDRKFKITDVSGFDMPPTAEERIIANPNGYAAVASFILRIHRELYFIDPYLNPCNPKVRDVIYKLFEKTSSGKCESITMFVRFSEVTKKNSIREIEEALWELKSDSNLDCPVKYKAVDDLGSQNKMHARYLFGIKGGIKLDNGFTSLRNNQKVEVAPIGGNVLEDLIELYIDGSHNYIIEDEVVV